MTNGEAVRLQKELAHARTVALANGVGVKSRLQALQIACVRTSFVLILSG